MRSEKNTGFFYLKNIAMGFLLSIAAVTGLFVYGGNSFADELFLYETIPFYEHDKNVIVAQIFKYLPQDGTSVNVLANNMDTDTTPVFQQNDEPIVQSNLAKQATDYTIIGTKNVVYQPEGMSPEHYFDTDVLKAYDVDDLREMSFLLKNFYTVNKDTELLATDIDIDEFLAKDMTIQPNGNLPKVLIFHTHSTEMFIDSNPKDLHTGIVGAGDELANELLTKYGIHSIHCTEQFDIVDGNAQITGAYERMEPEIEKILKENPSIEIAIDIHRDGVNDDKKFVTEIDGKSTARIMFLNGLSRLKEGDKITELDSLPNENLKDNMAFSFRLQLAANEMFPGFTRKIFLRGYRYSLHMKPKSLLVEIGTQNNTMDEAFNAMDILAELLADVVLTKE